MKRALIILAIIISIILLIIGMCKSTNNKAIKFEEQIKESSAGIEMQEKRKADLLIN